MVIAYIIKQLSLQGVLGLILFFLLNILPILYFWKIKSKTDRNRNGVIAFLLSLFGFGIGQAYNRQILKAFIMFLLTFGSLYIFMKNGNDALVFLPVLIYLYSLADAAVNSKKSNQKAASKVLKKLETRNKWIEEEIKSTDFQVKLKRLLDYSADGFEFAIDTNFLMHEPDVLLYLLRETDICILMSNHVFRELEGLKTDKENKEKVKKAQFGFDILEGFQRNQRLKILETAAAADLKKLGLGQSPDEKIIATYINLQKKGRKLIFLSNDKGARIIARDKGLPVAEIGKDLTQAIFS